MTAPTIEILADKAALVQRALGLVCDRVQQSVADHGYCTLALAGGSTPKPLYAALAQQDLPWFETLHFFGQMSAMSGLTILIAMRVWQNRPG